MTEVMQPPALEQEDPILFTETKERAKRRIRVLAASDKRLHRLQRQLFRGRLKRTRSVQWHALLAMASMAWRCVDDKKKRSPASSEIAKMMWRQYITTNTPANRQMIVRVLEAAIDCDVLPTNLSEWPEIAIMALYPRSVAHLICGSSGYATAGHAARMVAHAHCLEADFCEWVDSRCVRTTERTSYRKAMQEATLLVVKGALRSDKWSPRRRRHRGYMVDYGMGRAEILKEMLGLNRDFKFAAWF